MSRRSTRKRPKVARHAVCLSPGKEKHPLWVARRIAAKQGSHVYPCCDHYHLTHKSWGAP